MKAYLLDTNHIGHIFDQHQRVMGRFRSLPVGTGLFASVISLGEIAAGHRITATTDHQRRDEFERFVTQEFRPHALVVSQSTREYYAQVIEGIWQRHPPASRGIRTEKHLVDLGVDINDVWIVAQTLEHNLILVTEDRMERIRESADRLLDVENWAE
ncbi:MAG: type II toxin-antitoxin system VapC family toxin [Planctomycetota bacterium]